ncbi:MAG: hypothetical protein IPI09_11675 [Burkholderiales bacterium]|nr:hypothetical protein [Burkholderiales bacterium]
MNDFSDAAAAGQHQPHGNLRSGHQAGFGQLFGQFRTSSSLNARVRSAPSYSRGKILSFLSQFLRSGFQRVFPGTFAGSPTEHLLEVSEQGDRDAVRATFNHTPQNFLNVL